MGTGYQAPSSALSQSSAASTAADTNNNQNNSGSPSDSNSEVRKYILRRILRSCLVISQSVMSRTTMFNISKLYDSYSNWVAKNPTKVGDVETAIKYASYFVAGRISSSTVISELIYSMSNLLVLFNDRIIEKSNLPSERVRDGTENMLVLILTRLEYCEVFIELSAQKMWGTKGKWFIIVVIQFIKCIGRLILTLHYKNSIVQSPPISVLDRKKFDDTNRPVAVGNDGDMYNMNGRITFTLRRSGRVVRKVDGAPPLYLRNWRNLGKECKPDNQIEHHNNLTRAETLYVLKPMIHLGGCALFGYKSWRSWSIALFIDLISLRMYMNNRRLLTKIQKVEISRRIMTLLLYLMRSPFYDKYSGDKINCLLRTLSKHIPFTKAIVTPLKDYIPYWQETYFHMWS
ncbi:peroxisomal membrane protein PEX16 [Culicoides brevitarsis]|uniref:peroxisomal membrane protein PEX16 n=1 Tax=Culicoides brevitarsis TaxID=469753 RepID=UPI00307CA641